MAEEPGRDPVTGQPLREWTLTIRECPDGRLACRGLPADRLERLSVVMRLGHLLQAVMHSDDVDHEGSGVLWQRYCRTQAAAWADEVTVTVARATVRVQHAAVPGEGYHGRPGNLGYRPGREWLERQGEARQRQAGA